jgi:hypothetical protein
MSQRLALGFLAGAAPALLLAMLLNGRAGAVIFAVLAAAFPVALMALGASRRGRLGRLAWPLLAVLGLLEGCVVGMLALAGRVAEGPWLFGLPLAAVLELGGLFLLPLPIVVLAYALTFRAEPEPPELPRPTRES